MSLAEWYMKNAWQINQSANERRLQDCLENAPEPLDDPGWATLCRDPQWSFKIPQSDEDIPLLFYSKMLTNSSQDSETMITGERNAPSRLYQFLP